MPQPTSGLTGDDIRALPEYSQLLHQRRKLAIPLTFVVLLSYYSFVLAVAYFPETLARPLGDGITSIGIVAGLGIIILTFLVTAIFVWRTNATSEVLLDRIHQIAGEKK